jgi:hypothetical protein
MIELSGPNAFIAGCEVPLKRFQSQKKVWAFKIGAVRQLEDPKNAGSGVYHWWIVPEDGAWPKFQVDAEWVRNQMPQAGGYFTISQADYGEQWDYWPARAFEAEYAQI